MIVADASVIVDFLLTGGGRGDWARAELRRGDVLHAPHLLDYETANVTRRKVLTGEISAERGARALTAFRALNVVRYPAAPFAARVFALRHWISSGDAFYIALAEALDCPLVTTDGRLARSHGHDAVVRTL